MAPVSHLDELQAGEVVKTRAAMIADLMKAGKAPAIDPDKWREYTLKMSGFPEDLLAFTKIDDTNRESLQEALAESLMETMLKPLRTSWLESNAIPLDLDIDVANFSARILLENRSLEYVG